MYIKIYTKSQLILLRSLMPLMKDKYRLPSGILNKVYEVLKDGSLGKHGFIAIIINPVQNDIVGIKDILNCYPYKLKIKGDIRDVKVEEQDSWMTKDREWYMDALKVKKQSSHIYVIYSMTLEVLYGSDKK